jgi:hypothetical protein
MEKHSSHFKMPLKNCLDDYGKGFTSLKKEVEDLKG